MALERIEIRLSPLDPDEAEVIEAVDKLDQYGAKARFFKERLLKGMAVVMREIESIKMESDQVAMLDRLAGSVNAGHYHLLKAMLAGPAAAGHAPSALPSGRPAEPTERVQIITADAQPGEATVSEQQPAEATVSEQQAVAGGYSDASPDGGGARAVLNASDAPPVVSESGAVPGDSMEDFVKHDIPKPMPNWSMFRDAAGTAGTKRE